uniref:Uncharacterized protein n=1 Tax=Zea mays TaxID=4577 RepID=A0A804QIQ7_MAIZE
MFLAEEKNPAAVFLLLLPLAQLLPTSRAAPSAVPGFPWSSCPLSACRAQPQCRPQLGLLPAPSLFLAFDPMAALLSLPSAHSYVHHGWAHGRGGPNPHRARPGLDPAPSAQLRPPSLAFPELALNLLADPPSPISDCALLLLAMAPSSQPGRSSLQLELPPPMDICSSSLSSRFSLCSPHLSPWHARPSPVSCKHPSSPARALLPRRARPARLYDVRSHQPRSSHGAPCSSARSRVPLPAIDCR